MTTAPATDLRLHYAHFLDLLAPALSPNPIFKFGEVPGADGNLGTVPDRYALLDIQRRPYAPTSLAAHPDVTGWAVSVVGVGRSVSEAAILLDRATGVLEYQSVVIDGHESTPLTFDTLGPVARDGRVFEGLITYTYVL